MKINEYGKQYFLYAKGWYKKSDDVFADLLKLYSINQYVAEGCEYKGEIIHKVTQCALECIMEENRSRSIKRLQDLLLRLSPNHWIRGLCPTTEIYDYEVELIKGCFSIMSMQTVENLDPEKDSDFNILPSSKEEK